MDHYLGLFIACDVEVVFEAHTRTLDLVRFGTQPTTDHRSTALDMRTACVALPIDIDSSHELAYGSSH